MGSVNLYKCGYNLAMTFVACARNYEMKCKILYTCEVFCIQEFKNAFTLTFSDIFDISKCKTELGKTHKQ